MRDHQTSLELETYNSWKSNAQSFPQETGLPTNSVHMLDSRVSSSLELSDGWQGNSYKFQPRPFNLQLTPDQFMTPGDNNLPKDPLELRLSLSLGVAKGKKEDKDRSGYDKKTNACSRIAIDLEESTKQTTNEDEKHSSFDAAEIAMTSSFVGDSNSQERSYSVQSTGLKHNENMSHEKLLTGKQQLASRGVGCVDLNEVQLDDLSCHSDDAILFKEWRGQWQHDGNLKNGEDALILKPQNGHVHVMGAKCVVAILSGCEKTGEGDNVLCSDKIQITVEDVHPNGSSPSGKSSCISDDDSNPFSGTHGRSKVAETLSGEQDQTSSGSNGIKHECYDNIVKSAEVDNFIQIAAESLISLKNSACYQKSSTQTASNELENEDKEQSQCSYDSFELMTLKQAENSAVDFSVSSKPFEWSDGLTKDFGTKLRRGRRLKDFQRTYFRVWHLFLDMKLVKI
ncbi:Flavin-binding monooxygenase family protein [Hibiscus syriacus]|uniref:Flavin-binding monooxygenase family protein n=1 Tax=Hibiscus syriacus TaxID=106335 RepID=A0A6A2YL09_HIBSY|nr:Flavin-binding monooxygenase family protein [Hibiscus syriacus]